MIMVSEYEILHYAKYNQQFANRRRLQFVSFALRNFLLGVQYGIILPSAWQYMKRLGAGYTFYGVILAMYPLGALFTSPFVAWIFHKTKRTKEIITLLHVVLVIGNLVYALDFSPWLPFCGRLLAGIGEAGSLVSFGEITLLTTPEQRISTYSYVVMGVIPGVFLGPFISLLLQDLKINIGQLSIDYTNAPGIFSAFMWLFMELICQFMTSNLGKEFIESRRNKIPQAEESFPEESDVSSSDEPDHLLTKSLSEPYDLQMRSIDQESECEISDTEDDSPSLRETIKEATSSEILAIYAASFSSWFLLLESDSLVPLITQEDLKWTVVNTSIVYMFGAAWAGFIYIIIGVIGHRVSNISCVIAMQVIAIAAANFAIFYQLNRSYHYLRQLFFCLAVTCGFALEPLNSAGSSGLLSSVTSPRIKGTILFGSYFVLMLAAVLGPIWGTYFYQNIILCASVNAGLSIASLFWTLLSIKKLKERRLRYQGSNGYTTIRKEPE